jgi:hypothetical protein
MLVLEHVVALQISLVDVSDVPITRKVEHAAGRQAVPQKSGNEKVTIMQSDRTYLLPT